MEMEMDAFAMCIYTGTSVPFRQGRVCSVLSIYASWCRCVYLLLILVAKVFPTTSIGKGNVSDRFPTPFLLS